MNEQVTRSVGPGKLPQQALLANALESVANAIFITDETGHIVWANQAFSRLCGYRLQEVIGNTPAMLRSGLQSEAFYADLWQTILSGRIWRGHVVERHKNGALYTVDQTITPLVGEHGVISHFIAIQQDVTLRRQDAEHEHYLAYHDPLTGLPNRNFFLDLEQQAMIRAKYTQHALALLFLDLDGFKLVNDTFGHEIGDQLLRAVAERLASTVRRSDTVGRFGGDEFAILVPDLLDNDVAILLARKLIATIAQPFMIAARDIHIGASIGISLFPRDGQTQEDLLRKADQAMYLAKKQGGGGYHFYCGDSLDSGKN